MNGVDNSTQVGAYSFRITQIKLGMCYILAREKVQANLTQWFTCLNCDMYWIIIVLLLSEVCTKFYSGRIKKWISYKILFAYKLYMQMNWPKGGHYELNQKMELYFFHIGSAQVKCWLSFLTFFMQWISNISYHQIILMIPLPMAVKFTIHSLKLIFAANLKQEIMNMMNW